MINLLLVVLLAHSSISTVGKPSVNVKWPKFKGAYFEVNYPPGFKARKSLPSNSFEG